MYTTIPVIYIIPHRCKHMWYLKLIVTEVCMHITILDAFDCALNSTVSSQ